MSTPVSINNISFNFLHSSQEFLNLIINEISSCILLLDKDMMLQSFNDPFKTIFSNRPNEHILYKRCGEAIGCAYTVEEMKDCGTTSKCSACELREKSLLAYINNTNVYKGKIIREFYKTDEVKALKFLQYSIKAFNFDKERYIIVIIDDITSLHNLEEL